MNEEFVNVYIEMMSKKIDELTKNEMLLGTRLVISEKLINTFKEENEKLTIENQKLQSILNKKSAKTKEDFWPRYIPFDRITPYGQ